MSPHRKRSSLVTRLAGILLLVLVMVSVTGIFTYKRFTGIVNGIREEINPDLRMLTAEELRGSIAEAEIAVKSYSITRDTMYLQKFQDAVEKTELKLSELNRFSIQEKSEYDIYISLDSLLEEKIDVLGEILIISDKFRADDALAKVETSIENTIENIRVDTQDVNEEKPANKKFFKWLFQRRKDRNIQEDTVELVPKDKITSDIEKVKIEEEKIANEMKSREFELMLKDQKISAKINFLLDDLREKELESITRETNAAQLEVDKTNKQIAFFFLTIAVLILFMAYFFLSYVKNSKQYRLALKNAKNEAEELASTKQRFLANMSHEIRTPMNAIFGFTEQISKGPLTAKQKEQITIVQKSTAHLLGLVNDVLDFSKLQAGELKLERKQFNIYELVRDMADLMQSESKAKNITLKTKFKTDLPPILAGDVHRLRQILLNLLSNAIKFTNRGEVLIQVDDVRRTENEILLKIEVIDTGIGMSKRQRSKVFKEFEQGNVQVSGQNKGTGLGLSIVKMLVELQKGSIDIESKPKKGTTVRMQIPYSIPTKKKNTKNPVENNGKSANVDLSKLSILAVDDEEFNRKLLESILSNWKCQFELAANGYEAIELASVKHYDLILMDARMPDLNGIDTTSAIKRLGKLAEKTKFIALTAAVAVEDRLKYKEVGMDGFLAKPFSETQLKEKVSEIVSVSGESCDTQEKQDKMDKDLNKDDAPLQIDFSHLLEVCGGDKNFYIEMLETFIRSSTDAMNTIDIGLKANDWEMIADQAHKIAPPAGHLGAENLKLKLRRLEKLCRADNSKPKELESLIYETKNLIKLTQNRVLEEIENTKKKPN